MSWEKTTIGEHCTVTSSKRFHLSDRTNCGVPFYCSKEIIQKVKSEEIDNCDYISEEFYEAVAQKYGVPQENDLLVTTRGTIGVPYLYKKSDRFYFADGNLTWMKDFQSTLLPQYLYYWFLSYEGQSKIDSIAKGTAQKAVPIAGIKTLELLLPPIEIQCRIADILSAYDELIENNRKQIKLLEEAAQRLYQEWFVDLRFPGHEHTKIVDGVPEGWRIRAVSDFGEVIAGKTPSTSRLEYYDGNIPFVTIPDMHNTIYPLSTGKRLSEQGANTQKNKFLPPDSVMVSCIATVGLVNIASEWCQTNQQINSVILEDKKDLYFFYFAMKRIKSLLDGVGSNGATMTNVNKTKFESIKILYPGNYLTNCFFEVSMPIFQKVLVLSKENQSLQQARDRLIPKLMSGEVEV